MNQDKKRAAIAQCRRAAAAALASPQRTNDKQRSQLEARPYLGWNGEDHETGGIAYAPKKQDSIPCQCFTGMFRTLRPEERYKK